MKTIRVTYQYFDPNTFEIKQAIIEYTVVDEKRIN